MTVTFFFSGIAAVTFAISGLLFLKFWKVSGDSFFKHLCAAFWMMAMERVVGLATYVLDPSEAGQAHTRTWIYLIRLLAFSLILIAVIQKNRSTDLR